MLRLMKHIVSLFPLASQAGKACFSQSLCARIPNAVDKTKDSFSPTQVSSSATPETGRPPPCHLVPEGLLIPPCSRRLAWVHHVRGGLGSVVLSPKLTLPTTPGQRVILVLHLLRMGSRMRLELAAMILSSNLGMECAAPRLRDLRRFGLSS